MRGSTGHRVFGAVLLLGALCGAWTAAREFRLMRVEEPLYPGPGVTAVRTLSEYAPRLCGSGLDTEVYVLDSGRPGGTVLVMGGTHPNEPAGFVAAVVVLECAQVRQGRLLVVPRANKSGFSCTDPGEGMPARFAVETEHGARWFRLGSRFTNWVHQWPDPLVYVHFPSGQRLSGAETRNLNRAFPGRRHGSPTERLAHALVQLVRAEGVDLVVDLHESAPEYPVNNAVIAHERASEVAAIATLRLQEEGLSFNLEPSPYTFHGLTHREIGDHTEALALLLETANPMQGRLRGEGVPEVVVGGLDRCYLRAATIRNKTVLRVPYDAGGLPLAERVGRHTAALLALLGAFSELHPDRPVEVSGLPDYHALRERGLGGYLRGESYSEAHGLTTTPLHTEETP